MANKFNMGDMVKIVTLTLDGGGKLNGVVGHVGKVDNVYHDNGEWWYELDPTCVGRCWPEFCFEFANPDLNEVSQSRSLDDIFEEKLRKGINYV